MTQYFFPVNSDQTQPNKVSCARCTRRIAACDYPRKKWMGVVVEEFFCCLFVEDRTVAYREEEGKEEVEIHLRKDASVNRKKR